MDLKNCDLLSLTIKTSYTHNTHTHTHTCTQQEDTVLTGVQ